MKPGGIMEKSLPYIGINGASFHQIDAIHASKEVQNLGYTVLAGVQATKKTQIDNIPNRYGDQWHPVGENMRRWWFYGNAYNRALHINSDTIDAETLRLYTKIMLARTAIVGTEESDLGYTTYYVIEHPCRTVQFNNLPFHQNDYRPLFEEISASHAHPEIKRIVLQANKEILTETSPQEFKQAVQKYIGSVASVLIDGSGGKGIPLEATAQPYIDAVSELDINVGIAGGLSAETLEPLAGNLLASYPELSIDAESGLREDYSRDAPAESTFSLDKYKAFVAEFVRLKS